MVDDFSLASLPYGSVRRTPGARARLCVALGAYAVELGPLAERLGVPRELVDAPNLDRLLAAEHAVWADLRASLQALLSAGPPPPELMFPLAQAVPCLPFTVGDYVDFFSSLEHATNLGRLLRPGSEPLLTNWRHLPVGYHGRASTVVVSGTPVHRPLGQRPGPNGPTWGLSEALDIEAELGVVVGGPPNALGEPIAIDRATERIFGVVIVNDWSARDIQSWEYQPLGPFLGKSFATSISSWVVPLAALERHRVPAPVQDPEPFEYLRAAGRWGLDINLELMLRPAGKAPQTIARVNARGLYWTATQQLVHMASNGAIVRPGDLYASGTISGAEPGAQGSLIELTRGGAQPLALGGVERRFLVDRDVVTIAAWAGSAPRASRLYVGEVSGEIVPTSPRDRPR